MGGGGEEWTKGGEEWTKGGEEWTKGGEEWTKGGEEWTKGGDEDNWGRKAAPCGLVLLVLKSLPQDADQR